MLGTSLNLAPGFRAVMIAGLRGPSLLAGADAFPAVAHDLA